MAVINISVFKTEPGRLNDHLALTAEATGLLRGAGLAAAPLQAIAGSDIGTIAMSVNHANNADYVASIEKVQADPGWQEFWARANLEAAAVQVESSLYSDLDPAFQPATDRPLGAVLATQWRAKPGRLQEFMAKVEEAAPHTVRMGGTHRVLQSVIGAYPMTILIPNGFADLAAYGAYSDLAAVDEEWQALWGGFVADPSADLVRSGIYVNIAG